MIYIDTKPAVNDGFLIFEFKIDDIIDVDFIKNESNYIEILENSRNIFSFDKMQSKELESIMNSFSSENLYKIVDNIYETNTFNFQMAWLLNKNKYNTMYDFIKENTTVNTSIFMDTPGYGLSPHFDNRFVFANFILNLENNPISTKFYDYRKNYKLIYEAPNKKGTGIFFLNYENSFHSYINDSTENRYAMISTLNLKIS